MLVGGWIRSNITLSDTVTDTNDSPTADTTSVSLEKMFMACQPSFLTAKYTVLVDSAGYVQSAQHLLNTTTTMDPSVSLPIWNATTFLIGQPPAVFDWHNDTFASDYLSAFINHLPSSNNYTDALTNPCSPLPLFPTISTQASDIFTRLFAITLRLNMDFFAPSPFSDSTITPAIRMTTAPRIFMSETMFYLSTSILAFDILVALFLYIRLPAPFLPRMPTNIASVVSYFAASHRVKELAAERGSTTEDVVERIRDGEKRYGFGKFVGTDGRVHTGIEREPFVRPVDGARKRRRIWRF